MSTLLYEYIIVCVHYCMRTESVSKERMSKDSISRDNKSSESTESMSKERIGKESPSRDIQSIGRVLIFDFCRPLFSRRTFALCLMVNPSLAQSVRDDWSL